jgi:hypothetical protein
LAEQRQIVPSYVQRKPKDDSHIAKAVVMAMRLGARKRRRALVIVRAQRVKEKGFTVNKIWVVILIAASTSAIAQQQPVTRVQTALNHLTVIEVAEPITMVAAGSEAFEIERHGTRVFVKPTKPDVATNLFVWTEHGRSIYELQPAGEVSKMDVLVTSVQQPPIRTAAESLSKEDVAKVAEQVLSQTLLNTQPVNAAGIKTQKNRVNVRLEDVVRGKDAIYVRYQVTNLSTVPYRVIAPNVSVLATEGNAGASMPPANQQLAAGYLERLGKVSSTPLELLHSEIDQQDVAPGKTSTGVLAIRSTDGSPQIYQFVFGSDNASPIVTAAVL